MKKFTEKHRDKSLHFFIFGHHFCIWLEAQVQNLGIVLAVCTSSSPQNSVQILANLELCSFLDGLGSFQIGTGPGFGLHLLLFKLGTSAGLDGLTPQKIGVHGPLPVLSS